MFPRLFLQSFDDPTHLLAPDTTSLTSIHPFSDLCSAVILQWSYHSHYTEITVFFQGWLFLECNLFDSRIMSPFCVTRNISCLINVCWTNCMWCFAVYKMWFLCSTAQEILGAPQKNLQSRLERSVLAPFWKCKTKMKYLLNFSYSSRAWIHKSTLWASHWPYTLRHLKEIRQ